MVSPIRWSPVETRQFWTFLTVSTGWTMPSLWAWWGWDQRNTSGLDSQIRTTLMFLPGPTQSLSDLLTGTLGCQVQKHVQAQPSIWSIAKRITSKKVCSPQYYRLPARLCCHGNWDFSWTLGSVALHQSGEIHLQAHGRGGRCNSATTNSAASPVRGRLESSGNKEHVLKGENKSQRLTYKQNKRQTISTGVIFATVAHFA